MRRLSQRLLGVALLAVVAAASGCHALFLRPGMIGEARVESEHFTLRTDAPSDARAALLVEAETMFRELDVLLPPAKGREDAGRREIVAFSRAEDFDRFLNAHIFAQDKRAIGFFCDMGRECALKWRDPPGPEDVRVLRHELVHQHLAARLPGRLPTWLEEGLAERIALGLEVDGPFGGTLIAGAESLEDEGDGAGGALHDTPAPPGRLLVPPPGVVPPGSGSGSSWASYRARRFRADASFAALLVASGRRSWLEGRAEPPTAIPPPAWAAGDGPARYVLHLLFIRFLEAEGEGRGGALGRTLARAARGDSAELDLSRRFKTLAALEEAFHAYVLSQGIAALMTETDGEDPEIVLKRMAEGK